MNSYESSMFQRHQKVATMLQGYSLRAEER
jgi:hypothetical protein